MIEKRFDKILQDYDKHCQRIAQSTFININENAKDKARRLKKLESHYGDWFEYYFPEFAKVKCAPFHIRCANAIIKNKRIRYLAEWYRSAAKSVHINMGIPLFLYLAKNDLRYMLLIGETEAKAKALLSAIQAELIFNKRIKNDYGDKFQHGDWAEGDFATTDGVRFKALGFGQSPRGAREGSERPDYITTDDVDTKKHMNNDRIMRESVDYITEDIWGSFDASDDSTERYIHANNNTHKNSITNRLKQFYLQAKQKAKENETRDIFYIHTVNAVKNLDTFEPSWEAKTSAEYWQTKYNETPYRSFMREFMNTHMADGVVFKPEWIQYCKILPYNQYDSIVAYGDLSFKDNACLKSIAFVGKIGRQFHLLHLFFRQTTRPNVAIWLYDTYEDRKLEGKSVRYMFEGLFSMDMFTNDFDEEGDVRGYYIPITPNKSPKGNKYDRIEAWSAHWERRNFFINEAEKNTADVLLLIETMLGFEKGAEIALDGMDACEGATSEVNKSAKTERSNQNVRVVSRRELQSHSKNRF